MPNIALIETKRITVSLLSTGVLFAPVPKLFTSFFLCSLGRPGEGGDIFQQSQKYDGNQKNHSMAFVSVKDDIRFEAVGCKFLFFV
jgi:hypothetical protein